MPLVCAAVGLGAAAFWPTASAAACPGRLPPAAYTPSDEVEHERQAEYVATNMLRTHTRNVWSSYRAHLVRFIRAHFPNAPTLTWVEIGTAFGGTTDHVLEHLPNVVAHAVDPTISSYDRRDATSQHVDQIRRRANMTHAEFSRAWASALVGEQRRAGRWPCRYSLHHKMSVAGAADFADGSIDVLFVDGLHTYDGVRADLVAYWPKLAPRSLLIMNDWIPPPICYQRRTAKNGTYEASRCSFPGVRAASCEFLAAKGLADQVIVEGPVGVTNAAVVIGMESTEEKKDTCAPWLSRAASSARAADSVRRLTVKEVTGADAAFVVTLDTKEGRRRMDRMRKSIVGPHITKIDGVHGKALAPEENAGVVERDRRSRSLSPREIGCILGHRKAWQAIVDSGVETAMVLEDDASKFAPDFVEKVALILKHTPADWGILLLGFWLRNHAKGANDNDVAVNAYVQRTFDFMLTDCYLITRATAQALLRSTPVDAPLDSWISRQSRSIPIYRHTFELGPPHESFTPRKKRYGYTNHHGRLVRQVGISEIGQHTNR